MAAYLALYGPPEFSLGITPDNMLELASLANCTLDVLD